MTPPAAAPHDPRPTNVFEAFDARDIDGSIAGRFERQVRGFPDRLAVECPRQRFTYAELNRASNRIAHAILDLRGEGSEPVALLCGQGALLVAAILGVLKAGKIYVPLDGRHPFGRLTQAVRDAAPAVLLCDRGFRVLADRLAPLGATVLDIADLDRALPDDNPGLSFPSTTPAYIYYTSGSTGRPKGVVDTHRNVLHNVMRYTNGLHICRDDRLSLVQSCSFSGCVSTQFSALLNGAALFPFDFQQEGPGPLAEWMLDQRLTMFHAVPALFRAMAERAGELPDLRLVRLEGDQASWSDVEVFRKLCRPGSLLVNGMGATETGIVRRFFIDHETAIETGPLPLGYGVEDMKVILADNDGVEVPPGTIGEIAIRSTYLALGYWRRPELTAQAFRASPETGGIRTYWTGDLGRMRPDGCLEYLGRKDFHSKVRGEHVEVDAVERALLALGAFTQVVVMTRSDPGFEARVVAYLVPGVPSPPDASSLRRSLEPALPPSSIPSAFVLVETLPLGENGKVDLRALPTPVQERPRLDTVFVPPATPVEERLVRLWAELLQIDRVGTHDRFLDLGGHSLLAARVQTRLRSDFGVDLTLRSIFDAATVAELAQVIDDCIRQAPDEAGPVHIPRTHVDGPLPLSFAQQRVWTLQQFDPAEPVYNEPRAVRLSGQLDHAALQGAFARVVDRHDALRMTIRNVGDALEQEVQEGRPHPIEIVDLRERDAGRREGEARQLLAERSRQRFDLAAGAPIRAVLVRLTEDEHIVLVVIHHIACDAWSAGNFWRELAGFYGALVAGGPSAPLSLPIRFADYVMWEREWLARSHVAQHVEYWAHRLSDLPTDIPLPAAPVLGTMSPTDGGTWRATLPSDLASRVEAFGAAEGATTFMVLLAGFAALLARRSGQHDIVIGSPVAGRAHPDAEGLIGCFVNSIVLRVDTSGQPTFREAVGRVRDVTLEAYDHQDAPFDQVVNRLSSGRRTGRPPLFRIAFSLQNVPWGSDEFRGLRSTEVDVSTGCSKIDLGLSVKPTQRGLQVLAEYHTGLFAQEAIESLIEDWRALLDQGVDAPDTPLSQLLRPVDGVTPVTTAASGMPVPPSTEAERALASIWENELGVGGIGRDDHFIDVGGHSLAATRIINRIEDAFGARVSHRELFESATIATLASLVDRKRQHARGAGNTIGLVAAPPAGSAARPPYAAAVAGQPATMPLAPGQQDVWVATELHPGLPVYNEPFTIRFGHRVDAVALQRALEFLIERHDILRTAFVSGESGPGQIVRERAPLRMEVVDVAADHTGEAAVRQRATAAARRPFDLTRPPLVRAMLARLGEDDVRLYLTVHHLVIDAVGLYEVFLPELATIYEALAQGRAPALDPLPLTFADACLRQGRGLDEDTRRAQLDYWRGHLAGAHALELPADLSRPAVPTGRGGYRSFLIPADRAAALIDVSRAEGVTLFTTLLAAFATLLHRWSGEGDLVIATFDAGRASRDVEPLLGYFLRALPLRLDTRGDPRFTAFLAEVRDTLLRAWAHADVPFSQVMTEVASSREGGWRRLVRVACVMEPSLREDDGSWIVTQHDVQTGTSKFDLTLEVERRREGIVGRFEYSADLFEEATIDRLVETWEALIESIAENPTERLSLLSLLSAAERQRLLVAVNDTERPYPRDLGVHEVFEQQVERTPDAVAVICGETALSYRALNTCANRLACELVDLGVGPGVSVAICAGRSIEFVVGVLAVMKAGGVFVPVDPSFPVARLRFMLHDTRAAVVLVAGDSPDVAVTEGRTVVLVKRAEEAGRSAVNLPRRHPRTDVASVMYTSGSSGEPKGVMVTHRGIVRLACGATYVPLDTGARFLLHSSIAFDASTFELWVPLLNGATCIILAEPNPTLHDLETHLHQGSVSCLWLTSSLFNTVMDQRPEMIADVRHLLVGGEALSMEHVRRALGMFPRLRLLNGYGPTENTTFTTIHEIARAMPDGARSIPIGRPIANTQVFVLDRHGQPVPTGFPGELCVGGDGLAQGYVNRPQPTAERFIDHPFSGEAGARLYRTGDLVRWRADGPLEFLGRLDRQVKVRGYRVEPGEVEAMLGRHPAVGQSAVEAMGEGSDRALVGFIVPSGPHAPSAAELRRFLSDQLPDYMIPTRWQLLAALPVASTGKVDRDRLHIEPEVPLPTVTPAPVSPIEPRVAAVFADILGRADLAGNHDFFAAGGHSLNATVLAARLRGVFGVEVSLRQIFDTPTPAGLARWIEARTTLGATSRVESRRAAGSRAMLVEIRPGRKSPSVFFAHSILGDVFSCEEICRYLPADCSVYGFRPADSDPGIDSIEATAAAYVELLADVAPVEPFCLAGHSYGGMVAFEAARQWVASGRAHPVLAVIDSGPAPLNRTLNDVFASVPLMLRNLPWWLWDDIARSHPSTIAAQVRTKLRTVGRRARAARFLPGAPSAIHADDVFDAKGLSKEMRAGVQRRLEAVNRYVPLAYPGRITLFRARARPLFHALERDLGWTRVAQGGLDVQIVPGNHLSMMQEPHVRVLAARLAQLLVSSVPEELRLTRS